MKLRFSRKYATSVRPSLEVARYDSALTVCDALGDRVLVFGGLRDGSILGGSQVGQHTEQVA